MHQKKLTQYWYLLILILPVFGEFSRIDFLGRSLILSDLITPLTLLALWIFGKKNNPTSKQFRNIILPLLAFWVIAFCSLLISYLSYSLSEVLSGSLFLIRYISYSSLAYFIYSYVSKTEHQVFWQSLIVISVLIGITGLVQLRFLPDLTQLAKTAGYDPHINRLVGSWLDPNYIGGFFAFIATLFAPVTIAAFQKKHPHYPKPLNRYLLLSFLIFLIILTFLTYSRSAYLALAIGFFIVGIYQSRLTLLTLFLVAIIGISVSPRAQERVGELYTSINSTLFPSYEIQDATARLRLQNWEQTWQLINEKPIIGHGYNLLSTVKLNRGFVASSDIHSASGSDSSLLTIFATTGILGLLAFSFFYLKILFFSWKNFRQQRRTAIGDFSLGLFSAILGLLIHSLFVNSLLFAPMMIFFFMILGVYHQMSQKPIGKVS